MAPAPLDQSTPHRSRLNPLDRPEPRRWRCHAQELATQHVTGARGRLS